MITVFFATQTGNAEESAENLLKRLTEGGLHARTKTLYDYKAAKLAEDRLPVFVVSLR